MEQKLSDSGLLEHHAFIGGSGSQSTGGMLEVHNPPDGGGRVSPFRPVRAGGPGQRAD